MAKPAKGVKKRPEKISPWATLSTADIQARIDLSLARRRDSDDYVSLKSVLMQVLGPELREEAEEALEVYSLNDILCPFLESDPLWVVRCSVTDSMVSGEWEIKSFILGKRGYLYHEPDFGIDSPYESLPIVGTWEPVDDRERFNKCFVEVYTATWDDFGLPPSMGQWVKGPFDLMLGAICTVLRKASIAWPTVLERLHRHRIDTRRVGFQDLVAETARRTGISSPIISASLQSPWKNREAVIDLRKVTERETRCLVAAFLILISGPGSNGSLP